MRPTFRFAPSPNGDLHLGHALSALTGFDMARRAGGRFLLRIEDIDTTRCRPEFEARIMEDLAWLGIEWEMPVLRQSEHFDDYQAAVAHLDQLGLTHRCYATRGEIAAAAEGGPSDPDGAKLHPGRGKVLTDAEHSERSSRGQPFAIRIDMVRSIAAARSILGGRALTYTAIEPDGSSRMLVADPVRWGDAILQRKDIPASYHVAVVVDDARQGVTHVTRGNDLLAATDLQRLLHVLLELAAPEYHHHRLVCDETGRKLAKSAGDTSLRALRMQGITPGEIRTLIGYRQAGY